MCSCEIGKQGVATEETCRKERDRPYRVVKIMSEVRLWWFLPDSTCWTLILHKWKVKKKKKARKEFLPFTWNKMVIKFGRYLKDTKPIRHAVIWTGDETCTAHPHRSLHMSECVCVCLWVFNCIWFYMCAYERVYDCVFVCVLSLFFLFLYCSVDLRS